ncbi:MAG: NHL repeat-containing protein [Thermomicrobiales bacterium]|nr:NHL repeat-containing protein [Thermomicrobiales bacterium]
MDDRQFDNLSRRVGESPLSRLPRRGLIAALGGVTLASAWRLEDDAEAKKKNKKKNKNKKCKKEGKKCDKKKCKKKDKKCCCNNLKCKDSVCTGKGGSCPTTVDFENQWGSNGSGNGEFAGPLSVTFDNNDVVYVTDSGNSRWQVFSADGAFQAKYGSLGNDDENFQTPQGIAWLTDGDGNARVVIADPGMTNTGRRLRLFRPSDGTWRKSIGQTNLANPTGVAVDSNNRIWVVDTTSPGEVYLYNSYGDPVTSWAPSGSGQLSSPRGIAVFRDSQNSATYVYVVDTNNDRVVKYQYNDNSSSGLAFVNAAGSTGSGTQSFNRPTEIAVDTCGNLWVADTNNNRVQILDKNLNFKSRFEASMNRPTGTAVNGTTLYVVNNVGNSVQRFSLS